MTTFNIKISGKESNKTTSKIAKILKNLDAVYLGGNAASSLIVVEYIDRGNWVTKNTLLSDQNSSCLLMSVFVWQVISPEQQAAFIKHTFAEFNNLFGDLHENSYISIQQYHASSYGTNLKPVDANLAL